MGRAPCCDKANMKRGLWSPEEDETLRNYVQNCGISGNWIVLPQKADSPLPLCDASRGAKGMYSSSGWDSYAWAFQAVSGVAEVLIHNLGVEEDPACGPLIDSVAMRALYPPTLTNSKFFWSHVFPNTTYGYGVLIPPNIEDDHSPFPGWMVESIKAIKYIDSDRFSVPQGRRAIKLVPGKESVVA